MISIIQRVCVIIVSIEIVFGLSALISYLLYEEE
jgi:hypothetical protein